LKLDIPKSNKKLRDYYSKAGFAKIGEIIIRNSKSFLMEKILTNFD